MPKDPEIYLVGDKQEVVETDRQRLLITIGNKLRDEYQVSTMAIMGLYDVVDLK